jgi:hypothetical protein
MARSATLSVRLDPETRRTLAEFAQTHDAAGASALARTILERWAADVKASQTRDSIDRAVSYLAGHPGGWDDDPADFFPGAGELG